MAKSQATTSQSETQEFGDELAYPPDTRSPTAKALSWVSNITAISVMMVLPAFGGYYLDQYFGTVALFMFIGMILGLAAGFIQLMKLVSYRNAMTEKEDAEVAGRRKDGQSTSSQATFNDNDRN